jgi:exosortase/archaeosortase family protein
MAAAVVAFFPISIPRRVLTMAAAVPLALALNLVRIVVVVEIALHYGAAQAEGFFHEFSSALVFLLGFMSVALISGIVSKRRPVNAPF